MCRSVRLGIGEKQNRITDHGRRGSPPRLLSNAFEMVSSEHRWYAANAVTLQFLLVSTTAYFHLHSTSLHVYDNIERLKYVMTSSTYTVTIKRVERLRYLKNLDGRGYLYDGYSK